MDLGALVVVAGRALGQEAPAVLGLLDVPAAEAALAEARSAAAGGEPAERAAALLSALIRHRPLARGNQQAAVLATVTFLAMNGWQVELEPAEATATVVAGLAAGRGPPPTSRRGCRPGSPPTPNLPTPDHQPRRHRCMDGYPLSSAPSGAGMTDVPPVQPAGPGGDHLGPA